MGDDNEFGTPAERAAVKAAYVALRDFNNRLRDCRLLNVRCDLTLAQSGVTYLADFKKEVLILPANDFA